MERAEVIEKIKNLDHMIDIAKKTKEDALKAKTQSATKMEIAKGELAKYGVTPETAESKIEELNRQIQELIGEVEKDIPVQLLKELHRL